jgi:hypothetical protein
VLLAESVLPASGTRRSNRERWVADPRGTSCSPASTNMVKLRLHLTFFWGTAGVEGDGVVENSGEGDDNGVNGVEGVGIGVNDVEGVERKGVQG